MQRKFKHKGLQSKEGLNWALGCYDLFLSLRPQINNLV